MIYLAGVDGGGTKTCCVIGDTDGNILARGISSGSNHQTVGPEAAKKAIRDAMAQAADALGIATEDISYTVLGLAGADLEPDFAILDVICRDVIKTGRFRIMNDTWIGLRAGIPENWGIVTVCGTGAACSGRNRYGAEATLRNLTYETGNYGGGIDILRMALHFAFRSEEGTGKKTRLEAELPAIFGAGSMADLVGPVVSMELVPEKAYHVPITVGRLAAEGDAVCQDILLTTGRVLGEIASGIVKKLGMEREQFKVTLVGSVFKSVSPLLVDEYTTTIHRTAPFAQVGISQTEPVTGAYYLALDAWRKHT